MGTIPDIVGDFQTWYAKNFSALTVKYFYSESTSVSQTVKGGEIQTSVAYSGYNSRKQLTIQASQSRTVAGKLFGLVSFQFRSYDFFGGVDPNTLGLNKGGFSYGDFIIAELKVNYVYDNARHSWVISASENGSEVVILVLNFYDLKTGELTRVERSALTPTSAEVDTSGFEALYSQLVSLDILSGAAPQTYVHSKDALWLLGLDMGSGDCSTSTYSRIDSRNTLVNVYARTFSGDFSTPDDVSVDVRTENRPLPRLARMSALDTGAWVNYPLGSTPLDLVARNLRITYNNIYGNLTTGTGVIQVIAAVTADMTYAFETNSGNAGINFSDLRTLQEAVKSYGGAWGSLVCRGLGLNHLWSDYVSAVVLLLEFNKNVAVPHLGCVSGYPYFSAIAGSMWGAPFNTILQFIKEDYSINESDLGKFYNLAANYLSAGGVFFSSINGKEVKLLGAGASQAANILAADQLYTNVELWAAVDRAFNALVGKIVIDTGSFELLDMTELPMDVGTYLIVETADGDKRVMVADYSMSFSSGGNIAASVSFHNVLTEA